MRLDSANYQRFTFLASWHDAVANAAQNLGRVFGRQIRTYGNLAGGSESIEKV